MGSSGAWPSSISTSMAGTSSPSPAYLDTTRTRVYETLHRFFAEEYAGLPDKSHVPKTPRRKVDFRAMAAIRRIQANPDLGEFRVHAKLAQMVYGNDS